VKIKRQDKIKEKALLNIKTPIFIKSFEGNAEV
jgi:hypothetical protein